MIILHSLHARESMHKRGIESSDIEFTLSEPDKIVWFEDEKSAIKKIGDYL